MKGYYPKEAQAIVIGAGNGGLVAALRLASEGVQVLLLEQHNLPGGYATSFMRGRFEFEASLHELCDVGSVEEPGEIRKILNEECGCKIDFVGAPDAYRAIMTDTGVDVRIPFGFDEIVEAIEREVPGSAKSVRRYLDLCQQIMDAVGYLAETKGNPDKLVLMRKYRPFLRTSGYTAKEVMQQCGMPKAAIDLLNPYFCYMGPTTSRMSSLTMCAMLQRYFTRGAYIPRGTSHAMSQAIVSRIQELGGRIELNSKVEKILTENGRVRGVRLAGGEEIASRHVISNASAVHVYSDMIDEPVPEEALQFIQGRKRGVSGFVVYLGLDATPEELGISDYNYFIGHNMDTDYLEEGYTSLTDARLIAGICPNIITPDCSPEGTTILTITALVDPEPWMDLDPWEYHAAREKLAEAAIKFFDQAAGACVADHIEEIEISTPVTYNHYTGVFEGRIYGFEPGTSDSFLARLMSAQDEKYIQGLELCGGFAVRGHGYNAAMASGNLTALYTLKAMEGSNQ